MATFRDRRIVEFADTDMAGIVHFANFFRFMEAAEHAYLRACGLSVFHVFDGQTVTFPRVGASCDYLRPARFTDVLEVEVAVAHVGRTSVRYAFTFHKGDEVIARGQITAVMCRVREDHALEPFPVPDPVRAALLAGPASAAKEDRP
jgi:YbgC/YbaW family acyl-CoA thioester hydrolase